MTLDKEFIFPLRVYVEDTDYGGFVYHANYLRFMERGRNEWCLARGLHLDEWAKKDVLFVVKSVQAEYIRPARFNDMLEVVTRVEKIGGASITYHQQIRRQGKPEEVFCQGQVIIVCINSKHMKAQPMPDDLMKAIR